MNRDIWLIAGLIFAVPALVFCAIISSSEDLSAEQYSSNGIIYELNTWDENRPAYVSGLEVGHGPDLRIESTIEYTDGYTYIVKGVNNDVFNNDTVLESIEIPSTVGFWSNPFRGCSNLSQISTYGEIPHESGDYSYSYSGVLYGINIWEDPYDSSFYTNVYLNTYPAGKTGDTFTLPESVPGFSNISNINLGDGCFYGNEHLKEVDLTSSNAWSIPNECFRECASLETVRCNSLGYVNPYAFYNCSNFKTFIANLSGLSISDYAFYGCTSLESFDFQHVYSVSINAFEGCTELKSVVSDGLETISAEAFKGCTSVKIVKLSSVSSIGRGAFNGCTSLSVVDINHERNSLSLNEETFAGCSNIIQLSIPCVKRVADGVFQDITELTDLDISQSLVNMKLGGYKKIESITVRDAHIQDHSNPVWKEASDAGASFEITIYAEEIPFELFSGCIGMKKITFSADNVSIGSKAFFGCTGLTRMCFSYPSVTAMANDAFVISDTETTRCEVLEFFTDDDTEFKKTINDSKNEHVTYDFKYGLVKIKFDTTLGKVETHIYCIGDIIVLPKDPKKEPTDTIVYVFQGWDGYTVGMTASKDETFTAKFGEETRLYRIAFENNDGEPDLIFDLEFNKPIIAPDVTLVKAESVDFIYTFKGWVGYREGLVVTDDAYFAANFMATLKNINVTHDTTIQVNAFIAELTTAQIRELKQKETGTFTLELNAGSIKLSNSAIKGLEDKAYAFSILPSNYSVNPEYFDISVGDATSFNGTVIVTLPYMKSMFDDFTKIKVFCIKDDGTKEEMRNIIYSSEDDTVSFETDHMSRYSIQVCSPPLSTTESEPVLPVVIICIVISLAAIGVSIFRRK